MIFTTFYTPGPYERLSDQMRASVLRHGFDCVATKWVFPAQDGWANVCSRKPLMILASLTAHSEPVIWIDADAMLLRYPTVLEDLDCAVAFHRRNGQAQSGTVYLTREAVPMVEEWARLCAEKPHVPDQVHLTKALQNAPVPFTELPREYCAIWDMDADVDAVILHRQASRAVRGQTNLHPDVAEAFAR